MVRSSIVMCLLLVACTGDDDGDGMIMQPDGGTMKMPDSGMPPPPGMVKLVNPSLAYDFGTDVYTLSFWIKNETMSKMRAVTKVRVTAGYSFPEITSADCPEDTPYYQWGLNPGELSSELGVAFASSTTIPKTVIDMTCGSRTILKSVPYGFNDTPPFDLHIEGLLANGTVYKLDATVQ